MLPADPHSTCLPADFWGGVTEGSPGSSARGLIPIHVPIKDSSGSIPCPQAGQTFLLERLCVPSLK